MNIKGMRSLGDGKFYKLEDILNKNINIKFKIGCDSLNTKIYSVYILSLVGIYPEKKGAFVYYYKEKFPKIKDIYQRLWKEASMCVDFAKHLRDTYQLEIDSLDFDFNTNPQFISNRLAQSAIGLAKSEGFIGHCKPNEIWGVYCADHIINCQLNSFLTGKNQRKLKW